MRDWLVRPLPQGRGIERCCCAAETPIAVDMDDLATAFSAISQASLQTRVDYAVARKVLDTQKQAGDAAVKLIEAAAETQAVAARSSVGIAGLGERVDARG